MKRLYSLCLLAQAMLIALSLPATSSAQVSPTRDSADFTHRANPNADRADAATAFYQQHPALATMQPRQGKAQAIPEANLSVVASPTTMGQAPMRAATQAITLWGQVIYADNWTSGQTGYGFQKFTTEPPLDIYSIDNTNIYSANMSAGGVFVDGRLYYINHTVYTWGDSKYLYSYDVSGDTWKLITSVYLSDYSLFAPAGVAVDPISGKIYGIFSSADGTSREFGTVDYATQVRTKISTVDKTYIALSIDAQGQCYAIASDGGLYTINKSDGQATLVGNTGVDVAPYVQSATFDQKTGTLYWAAYTGVSGAYVSSLYTVDTATATATKIGDFTQNAEISMLYKPTPLAEDGAPAEVADFSVTFEKGSKQGTATFTMPTTTYAGEALTGSLDYEVSVASEVASQGTAAAGEQVTVPIEVTGQSGSYEIAVRTRNDAGYSPKSKVTMWVGYARPYAPSQVVMELDSITGHMSLTWKAAPSGTGAEGYYGETTFDVVRYPDGVKVVSGDTATTFEEQLSTVDLKNYYYGVTQKNGDMSSAEALSNSKVIGLWKALPYVEPFSTKEDFALWTAVDGNADGKTWEYSVYKNAQCITARTTTTADDWLISPPIKAEKGRKYTLEINAACSYSNYPERLLVKCGTSTDTASFHTMVLDTVEIADDSDEGTTLTRSFVAPADGEMRLAIVCVSRPDMLALAINKVSVLAGATAESPATCTGLTVEAAPQGQLKSTVTFTTPTQTFGGTALSSLSKVLVYRNYLLLSTIESPKPGTQYSVTDNAPNNGMNNYIVTAYNDHGMGDAAETNAWIGIDIPAIPDDLAAKRKVTDLFDGSFTLSWPRATKGQHGGYVDPSAITYNVYERGRYSYVPFQEGIKDTTYTIKHDNYYANYQDLINYGLSYVSAGGESSIVSSAPYMIGKPFELPFVESYKGKALEQTWWSYSSGSSKWSLGTDAYDSDGGSAVFTSATEGENSMFLTGKIDIAPSTHPIAVFRYKGTGNLTNKLNCVVNSDFTDYEDITQPLPLSNQWQIGMADLSAYKDSHYIMFGIRGTAGQPGETTLIDHVRIFDALDANMAVDSLKVPDYMRPGQKATAVAHVANMGLTDATDVKLTLYVGDRVASTRTIARMAALDEAYVDMDIDACAADDATTVAKVVVECATDMSADDNTVEKPLEVRQTALATVTLTGQLIGCEAHLSWVSPASADLVCEDFESYDPMLIDNLSPWTTVDGDSANTYYIEDLEYDGAGEPMAFMTFNPYSLAEGMEVSDEATANSGEQYLISFNPAPDTSTDIAPDADDWLISPALPGVAQTISFYAKSLTTEWGGESFEVLYSTTDTDTAHFVKIGSTLTTTDQWQEYTATLPAGAKHFAIRVVSNNKFAFMLDDISYACGDAVPQGFNVYRDKQLVRTLGATATKCIDAAYDDSYHTWQVSVVYANGESPLSNEFSGTTAIDGIKDDKRGSHDVYTVGGTLVGKHADSTRGLHKGVYIVDGKKVVKR